jgi:hypothetical protein
LNSQIDILNRINSMPNTGSTSIELSRAPLREAVGEYYTWPNVDGRFHKVPMGFKWPSDTVFNLWNLWFCGDFNQKIGPYKYIESIDLPNISCKKRRSDVNKVINKLLDIAIEGKIISCRRGITMTNCTSIFDYSFPLLVHELYGRNHVRPECLNIYTVANRMSKSL